MISRNIATRRLQRTQNRSDGRHGNEFEVGDQHAGEDVQDEGSHHGGHTTCRACDVRGGFGVSWCGLIRRCEKSNGWMCRCRRHANSKPAT